MGLVRVPAGVALLLALLVCLVGCTTGEDAEAGLLSSGCADIVADTSFLADIVGNVAGSRLTVSSLIPQGADPHTFEPTPRDAGCIAECRAMVINVAGLAPAVDDLLEGVRGKERPVIEAAFGLPGLQDDPHCWLDPISVVTYVENIAAGLGALDPAGAETYAENAAVYAETLRGLDSWIRTQVDSIPPGQRLLVTDHESLGRFAERYGFELVGAVFPTTTGEGSPSARRIAELIDAILQSGAPAIFLESGGDSELAEQVGEATGATVVTDLYTHSLGPGASTYIEMMRWNVSKIVEALK